MWDNGGANKITGDLEEVIQAATRAHEKFDDRTPIEYHFLDQQLESFYAAENRAGMNFRMGGVLRAVAFLIATPVAWYVMKEWLAVFEYRIPLHAGIFMLWGLVALVITLQQSVTGHGRRSGLIR